MTATRTLRHPLCVSGRVTRLNPHTRVEDAQRSALAFQANRPGLAELLFGDERVTDTYPDIR